MSDKPTADVPALLQELHHNVGGRLQAIEQFLVAIGAQMQSFGNDLKQIDHMVRLNKMTEEVLETMPMLLGQIRAAQLSGGKTIRDLAEVEFKVFSQWGEHGIIEWIVAHLPDIPRLFIEFGVEDFYEASCRFLLENRNWKGLVMDGSLGNMQALYGRPIIWKHNLTGITAFVTAENIDTVLAQCKYTGPVGILSIDIDGNDYWVWDRISVVDPAIVICEMNAVFGDRHPVSIPYDAHFERLKAHASGQYFGVSIAALRHLAEKKGYVFLGTNSHGVNAFFVRRDLADNLLPLIETIRAYPSLHRDSRSKEGYLTFLGGTQRLDAIGDMPVVNVVTGETVQLGSLERPYSDEWLAAMAYDAPTAAL